MVATLPRLIHHKPRTQFSPQSNELLVLVNELEEKFRAFEQLIQLSYSTGTAYTLAVELENLLLENKPVLQKAGKYESFTRQLITFCLIAGVTLSVARGASVVSKTEYVQPVRQPSIERVKTSHGLNTGNTQSLQDLFKTPDSLGARVIGAAEGNYGIDGKRNKAYYGHSDPGNAVWNQGFCSDQGRGGGNTDRADQECLKYARQKLHQVEQDFAKVGLVPTQEEALNLMDLFNQAHPDVSSRFPGELKKEKQKGNQGRDAIANARSGSFYINGKNTAGGLRRACRNSGFTGSDWDCIKRDQLRRVDRIGEVLDFAKKEAAQTAPELDKATPAKGEMIAGYEVTSPWGRRKAPVAGASTFHKGTDVGMPEGTPVHIIGTGQNFKCSWDGKGGNVASFDSPEVGASFDYLHLSECDEKTRTMRVGNTGLNGGPHLHITQRDPKTLKKVPAWRKFVEWAIKGKP